MEQGTKSVSKEISVREKAIVNVTSKEHHHLENLAVPYVIVA